jgi:hypothetical protein
LEKFSSHWKSLAKTLPQYSKYQNLSRCPGAILFAIHKSLRLKAAFNTTLRETVMMMVI